MDLHECFCRDCQPRAFPSGPRRGPQHAALRFGDYHFRVTLNGERLQRVVLEAVAGGQGFAVALRLPTHVCGCGRGRVCLEILRGMVEVERPRGGDDDD